ncbi:hypothetical protein [Actinoplanes sp. N902-109]|uniref:hypothetical protein n=1 Tax=Actinoplanes sp. (strain N902-109) TaxID=649831 RepID=UPI0003A8771C|nr:hypothetical protein [Actinoplanes sp. N902-109]
MPPPDASANAAGTCYDRVITGTSVLAHLCYPEQWLNTGGTWWFGPDDTPFKLLMQTDGNLVMYLGNTTSVLWRSRTQGTGSSNKLLFQNDGNLVIYKNGGSGDDVWSTGTWSKCTGYSSPRLALQKDGNFVIYCETAYYQGTGHIVYGYRALWATGTNVKNT